MEIGKLMETRYDTGYEEVLHSNFYISQEEYHLDYLKSETCLICLKHALSLWNMPCLIQQD